MFNNCPVPQPSTLVYAKSSFAQIPILLEVFWRWMPPAILQSCARGCKDRSAAVLGTGHFDAHVPVPRPTDRYHSWRDICGFFCVSKAPLQRMVPKCKSVSCLKYVSSPMLDLKRHNSISEVMARYPGWTPASLSSKIDVVCGGFCALQNQIAFCSSLYDSHAFPRAKYAVLPRWAVRVSNSLGPTGPNRSMQAGSPARFLGLRGMVYTV